jgi:hypothetical protein
MAWSGREPGCGQDPPDGSRADAIAETEELTLNAPVPPPRMRRCPRRGFCLAYCLTSSRISSGTGGRPVVFG